MEDVGHDFISRDSAASGDGRLQKKYVEKDVSRPRVSGNIIRRARREVRNCAGGQWTAPSFQPTIAAQS